MASATSAVPWGPSLPIERAPIRVTPRFCSEMVTRARFERATPSFGGWFANCAEWHYWRDVLVLLVLVFRVERSQGGNEMTWTEWFLFVVAIVFVLLGAWAAHWGWR